MSEPSETVALTFTRAQAERLHRILMFDEGRGIYTSGIVGKLRRALEQDAGGKVYDWHALRKEVVVRQAKSARETQHGRSERFDVSAEARRNVRAMGDEG